MFKVIGKKPIKNYSMFKGGEFKTQKNELSPVQPARILICGSSGKGKTNLLLSLLFEHLDFTRIYVYCKDPQESKYQLLKTVLEQVQLKDKRNEDFFWFSSDVEDIVEVDSLDKSHMNVIIFDDLILSSQNKISDLFIRGRKKNATIIYLTQSYYKTPKLVRLQCNYKIFFKCCDNREMLNIFQNEGCDLDRATFVKLFQDATSKQFSFFMIDNETESEHLKFRKNLDYGFIRI